MARLAGDGSHYKVALLDSSGNPTAYTFAFPSVTTILDAVLAKPALMAWYYGQGIEGVAELFARFGDKAPKDAAGLKSLLRQHGLTPWHTRNKAADIGRDVHYDLELMVATGAGAITVKPENKGILNWWNDKGLTELDIVASEVPLVSFQHKFAGTADLIYRDPHDGALVCCDLKTSKDVYFSMFLQDAAYKIAWDEHSLPHEKIDRLTVLHVPREGKKKKLYGAKGYKEITTTVEPDTFLAIKRIYDTLPSDWVPEEVL